MKIIIKTILIFGSILAFTVSCSNNTSTKESSSVLVVDNDSESASSIDNNDYTEDETDEENIECPSNSDVDDFETPDLSFFEVKGHVKSIKYTQGDSGGNCDEILFDKNGNLTNANKYFGHKFKRNNKGQISVVMINDDEVKEKQFAYDKNGYISKITLSSEWYGDQTYTERNANGWCTHYHVSESNQIGELEIDVFYTKFDSHGNWIEKKEKTYEDYDMNGENNPSSVEKIKREIVYF